MSSDEATTADTSRAESPVLVPSPPAARVGYLVADTVADDLNARFNSLSLSKLGLDFEDWFSKLSKSEQERCTQIILGKSLNLSHLYGIEHFARKQLRPDDFDLALAVKKYEVKLQYAFQHFTDPGWDLQVLCVDKFDEALADLLSHYPGLKQVWQLPDYIAKLFTGYEIDWLGVVQDSDIAVAAHAFETLLLRFLEPHMFAYARVAQVFEYVERLMTQSFAPVFQDYFYSSKLAIKYSKPTLSFGLEEFTQMVEKRRSGQYSKSLITFIDHVESMDVVAKLYVYACTQGAKEAVLEGLSSVYKQYKAEHRDARTYRRVPLSEIGRAADATGLFDCFALREKRKAKRQRQYQRRRERSAKFEDAHEVVADPQVE